MKIGLSLSFCVKDICEGKVDLKDVCIIITNTRMRDEDEINVTLEHYCKTYWRTYPEQAREVIIQLFKQGKIHQPKLNNPDYGHYIDKGYWIEVASI